MIMKSIRNLIGSWTLPENVYVCSLGAYWIHSIGIPDFSESLGLSPYCARDYSHPHNYQEIRQSFWGVWEESSSWLGLHNPLPELKRTTGS